MMTGTFPFEALPAFWQGLGVPGARRSASGWARASAPSSIWTGGRLERSSGSLPRPDRGRGRRDVDLHTAPARTRRGRRGRARAGQEGQERDGRRLRAEKPLGVARGGGLGTGSPVPLSRGSHIEVCEHPTSPFRLSRRRLAAGVRKTMCSEIAGLAVLGGLRPRSTLYFPFPSIGDSFGVGEGVRPKSRRGLNPEHWPEWRSVAAPGCAVRSSRDCQTGAFAARKASKPCVRGEEGWATASGDGSGALGTRRRRTSVRVIPSLPAPPPCRSDPFRRILGPQRSLSAFGRNGREVQNHRPALSSW